MLFIVMSCTRTPKIEKELDIQGHRGARGLAPENSIPAFLMAAEMGVTTLELDLSVSKDMQLVVSHEPYFSPTFCLDSLGNAIRENVLINMYQMDYKQIKLFDCGSKGNPRFPDQKLIPSAKPLLRNVIDTIEAFTKKSGGKPLRYNIELKTTKATDSVYHPTPQEFSEMVFDLINEKGIWDRVTIQSFDFRTLQYFKEKYPYVTLVLLVENGLNWTEKIDSLGFVPDIYSCHYELLTKETIESIQESNMLVIPWTVNDVESMERLIDYGVDGLITDYPDRALSLISKY